LLNCLANRAPICFFFACNLRCDLPAGDYAYCGSAYGPGGIGARVARHLRTVKPVRWHIDRLTAASRIRAVGLLPGGGECDLVHQLLSRGAEIPLPGFGSSDCRTCPAHLLQLPPGFCPPIAAFDVAG
jgi:Uri superfamily endonuclease